jgi:hypothetical protein
MFLLFQLQFTLPSEFTFQFRALLPEFSEDDQNPHMPAARFFTLYELPYTTAACRQPFFN